MTSLNVPQANSAVAAAAIVPHFPVVGIGASAGGLKAVSQFLAEVGTKTGMAFVVIQHLDPIQESHLVTLLRRSTQLPVDEAVDGIPRLIGSK